MHKLIYAWGQDRLEVDYLVRAAELPRARAGGGWHGLKRSRPRPSTPVGAACDG